MEPSIFKVLTESEWESFKASGNFAGSPVDLKDGYIHTCTPAQLEGVIERYYANRGQLYIAEFSANVFGDSLRWEPASNGENFPHLYDRPLRFTEVLSWVKRGQSTFDPIVS